MSGLDHGWDKGNEPNHADFIHGGVPVSDFDDDFKYRKPSKGGRKCKRSKDGVHDFSVPLIKFHYRDRDGNWHYSREITCSKCRKHDWATYYWFTTKEALP